MSSDQLIPINQIAKMAGTDKIHLAYLTKLRLLPQTIRRKINGQIMGCYPEYVISLIQKIEALKNRGLTYSQIRFELGNTKTVAPSASQPVFLNDYQAQPANSTLQANPMVFLVIGLVLGYVLFSLNTINTSLTVKNAQATVATNTLPDKSPIITTSQNEDQPIYLIAIPNKNLYKLGQTNLTNLIR